MKQKKKARLWRLDTNTTGINFVPSDETKVEKTTINVINHVCASCDKVVSDYYDVCNVYSWVERKALVNDYGVYYCDKCAKTIKITSKWHMLVKVCKRCGRGINRHLTKFNVLGGNNDCLLGMTGSVERGGKVFVRSGMYKDTYWNKWVDLKEKKQKKDLELMRQGLL